MRTFSSVSIVCALLGIGCGLAPIACGDGAPEAVFTVEPPKPDATTTTLPPGTPPTFGDAGPTQVVEASVDCDATPGLCLPPAVCGDGKAGIGESCDDNNTNAGDGCSATCQVEAPYWACAFGVACVDVRDCGQLIDAGLSVGVDGGCVVPPKPEVCGDSVKDPSEACDDGNVVGGDGCSVDCKTVEANYVCQAPGQPCITTVVCGDGKITGSETCDDGNTTPGDGCSDLCKVEPGWECPKPLAACRAADCGDGLKIGAEECDDGNKTNNDGCSSTCKLQSRTVFTNPTPTTKPTTKVVHYNCAYPVPLNNPPRQVCAPTTCGNGVKEGTEQCDDNNNVANDGCNPNCELEPNCPNGHCVAKCGDGVLFDFDANGDGANDEACDDGNVTNGDGCSASCTVETGYSCTPQILASPTFIDVPVVVRDFTYFNASDPFAHPDFENDLYKCPRVTPRMVMSDLSGGVPAFRWNGAGTDPESGIDTNTTCTQSLTGAADFADWYRDLDVIIGGGAYRRSKRFDDVMLRLTRSGSAGNYSYSFDSRFDEPYETLGGYFPIDGRGWGDQGAPHNYAFTTELRYWFTYDATKSPRLDFSGDDDVWVFVNNKLALDLGGLHARLAANFVLDPTKAAELGLVNKHVYEVALFHAERHTNDSNFWLTLRGFEKRRSVCGPVCGDGIRTPEEQCDKGAANVPPSGSLAYDACTTSCTLGPSCGDAIKTTPPEECDDGTNVSPWAPSASSLVCAPGCKKPTYCGDGLIQSSFGELCDNGSANTNSATAYGACRLNCVPGPRCGDGIKDTQFNEQCDNGFNVSPYVAHPSGTDCAPGCKLPAFCGDGAINYPFEQCDNGTANDNSGAYGTCSTNCTFGPRCGDGIIQKPQEECDDGNRLNGDGCSAVCLKEGPK